MHPDLRSTGVDGGASMARDNKDRRKALFDTFFLPAPERIDTPPYQYPKPAASFINITNKQIHRAITKLANYKALGPSKVSNAVLTNCQALLVPYLGPIFWATFTLGIYPERWKLSETLVLRKPGKPDYALTKVYRPIALLNTIAKVLSLRVAKDLTYMTEHHNLLPANHFGGRPGCTATDSLHMVTRFIKDM